MTEENLSNWVKVMGHDLMIREGKEKEVMKANLTPRQQIYQRIIDGGKWNSRDAVGQQFRMEHANCEKWKACATPDDVEEFRRSWARKTLDYQTNVKSWRKSFKRIDTSKGKYLAPEVIIDKEGGWGRKASVRAGKLHIAKCFGMGPPWVSWNGMTERYDILYLQKQWHP